MRLEKLPGFGLIELAIWPQPFYESGSWVMFSLKLRPDNTLHWYRRFVEKQERGNHAFAEIYKDYSEATEVALQLNKKLKGNINQIPATDLVKSSLCLKAEKALTAKMRLMNEEQLMLEVAIKKHANNTKGISGAIVLESGLEKLRDVLSDILYEMPYLKFVYIRQYGISLSCNENNIWSRANIPVNKAAKIFYQERIARGYGLSGFSHWGKTKSTIRSMLLPRANQLLQLASVKRMLAEAKMKGQKVLLVDGFIFWYEEHNQIGWVVKEANDSGATSKGNTLWKEGTILSKNHGRIVVLPYIKENGEFVQGHTKNAPHDGKALPRHQEEYVELPFEVLEGDFMRGLFGELVYE